MSERRAKMVESYLSRAQPMKQSGSANLLSIKLILFHAAAPQRCAYKWSSQMLRFHEVVADDGRSRRRQPSGCTSISAPQATSWFTTDGSAVAPCAVGSARKVVIVVRSVTKNEI